MPGKETNPIQQRMELLAEKWGDAVATPGVNVVRIHAEENEKDMVEAFCTYLLGIDTANQDIPVIFESIYHDDEQYSNALLNELKSLIDLWNNANKDAVSIKTEPIQWTPDFSLRKKENEAFLFTENLNRLAGYLSLGKGIYLVAILKVSFIDAAHFTRWMELALKAGIHHKCKFLLYDTAANPFFDKLAGKHPAEILTLQPGLDMDNAMQQVAAMGKPDDPAVQYRQAFMKMMQSIEKRKEAETKKNADDCIGIAINNLEKNPYWIGQVIAVYAALANDQVGYKNYKKAIGYANEGIEAAVHGSTMIKDEFINKKFFAQAVMLRASLYTADKNWEKAIADFEAAASNYIYTNDIILAVEACRMAGYCNDKFGNNRSACKWLAKAIELAKQIPPHIIKVTTFAGVIELLISINDQQSISQEEVEQTAIAVYGADWMKEVMNWKNPRYEQVTDPSKTIVAG